VKLGVPPASRNSFDPTICVVGVVCTTRHGNFFSCTETSLLKKVSDAERHTAWPFSLFPYLSAYKKAEETSVLRLCTLYRLCSSYNPDHCTISLNVSKSTWWPNHSQVTTLACCRLEKKDKLKVAGMVSSLAPSTT